MPTAAPMSLRVWTASLHMPGALPDQGLVSTADDLDRLGQLTVTSDLAQLVGVGADHVGQGVRLSCVALRARDTVALTAPRCLQRIDREDPITGRDQSLHPGTTISLDPPRPLAAQELRRHHPHPPPVRQAEVRPGPLRPQRPTPRRPRPA